MIEPIELLSARHFFWLGLTAAGVGGALYSGSLPQDAPWRRPLRLALFVSVLLNESAWFAYRHFALEVPLAKNLPLHLCDMSVFILLALSLGGGRLLAELLYYAGAVGALLAVCLPAISERGAVYPVAEFRYFFTHIALVVGGFYFTFGRRFYPDLGAPARSCAAVLLFAAAITPLNLYLGTNYFFTLSAPKQLAFLHAYPHWLFCLGAALVFLAVFFLLHLPFVWIKNRRARRAPDATQPTAYR